jgi:arabinose-5-phosphate isomerase
VEAGARPAHATARRDARRPRTIRQDALAVEAAELMEAHRITSVLVVDAAGRAGRRPQHCNDLMRAKVI